MRLSVKALLATLAGAILFPATSPAPVFLKIEGIDGEATDHEHKDWINLISLESVIHRDIATRSAAEHGPIRVIKPIDKATPLLMEHLVTGQPLPDLVMEGVSSTPAGGIGDDDTGAIPYFQFRMSDATVTSIQHRSNGDDSLLEERFTFKPIRVEWHVSETDSDGTVIDRVSTFYDAELNESGVLPQAPLIDQPPALVIPTGETAVVEIGIRDFDTDPELIQVAAASSMPSVVEVTGIDWADGIATLSLKAMPLRSSETVVTISADDGDYIRNRSFIVEIEGGIDDPFDGFMKAYFNAEELADPLISSPVADPDGDNLATLLEFIFGTNPREFTPATEQLQKAIIHAQPGGGDSEDSVIQIEFQRRIDEPRLRLDIYGSPDGKTWTLLKKGGEPSSNPLYEESTSTGSNPLYESVTGTVDPPGASTDYFLRFVGQYN